MFRRGRKKAFHSLSNTSYIYKHCYSDYLSSCRCLLCSSVGGSEVIGLNKTETWKNGKTELTALLQHCFASASTDSVCYRTDQKILLWTFRPLYRSATRYFAENLHIPCPQARGLTPANQPLEPFLCRADRLTAA